MKLNVLIPTFNRAESLEKTLNSFVSANKPQNLEILITLIDNNSTDDTPQIFEKMKPHFERIKYGYEYIFEKKQGRSFALNAGIAKTECELLSAIDDDELIDENWFVEIENFFGKRWEELDFVGGKILPVFEKDPPDWIEPLKEGVICWRDFGEEEWVYDRNTPMLTGGHGIFKTSVFKEIGLYQEQIGAQGKGFISGEDEVLYDQLLTAGKRGIYNPKLIVYHYVPAYRMDKNYYRRWLFGVGMSRYLADVYYKPIEGKRIFGVPRWMYRSAFGGLIEKIKFTVTRKTTDSLAAENQPLIFSGFFYSKNLQNSFLDKPLTFLAKNIFKSSQR